MLNSVEWGEFKLGDLFEIQNTLSFNKDSLTVGYEYDYVTRTSQNQGILQETGFVNQENINSSGTWSLGLLQMDFFYRERPWYAGQFVRKIIPKIKLTKSAILYLTTLLNKEKKNLLSGLVRDVDKAFIYAKIQLPIKNGKINFSFMEKFIAELEAKHLAELEAYLVATGLIDYTLTAEEQRALKDFENLKFEEFNIIDIFDVKNTKNILSRDIVINSGKIPYLCASSENNAVSSYISYDENYLDKGNCVFIGGKTFVVTYQENDFYSNDSHNLVLYLKDEEKNKLNQMYLATCINKSLKHKYSWGDSISNRKIQTDKVSLPTQNNQPNYTIMETFISAIQKLVIKDVVLYADEKIATTKNVLNK
ncbi:MAG: restriction endonuclease subunit S [Sulfurimonas sp.]|jgi:hypothetical protein|uniref:restriction endonuclease subunit S n=1 Tax=Sulfurimonas sp. TaxID=2022749 RepID=UPI0035644181